MTRAKIGLGLLTLWGSLNILVAAAVTLMTLTKGKPPALLLSMSGDAILQLDPQAVAVVNAQAALANPVIIGFCVLVLAVLWTNRPTPKGKFRPILVFTLAFVQLFAFISDGYLGHKNLPANVASTLLLAVGLALILTSREPAFPGRTTRPDLGQLNASATGAGNASAKHEVQEGRT
jgi:hypothetical protein